MKSLNLGGSMSRAVLGALARVAPDPLRRQKARLAADLGSEEFDRAYGRDQYMSRVRNGMCSFFPNIIAKDVLELGCGHGGIAVYMAAVGARRVVGIDVNDKHLRFGLEFADELEQQGILDRKRIELVVMDCHELTLPDASFDVVVGDNLFEHVTDPGAVLRETFRVLRPGGQLVVPTFSSIWSKHGLHLKNGLKVPWANLLFSEETIIRVVRDRAERTPVLFQMYPGLQNGARTVRDLRAHKDLNSITHAMFLKLASDVGFRVESFVVYPTMAGRVVRKLRAISNESSLLEVLSTGAGALLTKA